MGKITIKHYLHKGAATQDNDFGKVQPVYVQVIVKRQVNRMRSRAHIITGMSELDLRLRPEEFEKAINNKDSVVGRALHIERKLIEDLVNFGKPFEREDFSIKDFTPIYETATESISDAINFYGKQKLGELLYDNWQPVFKMIDFDILFEEMIEGLTSLGTNNKSFKSSVLADQYLSAAIILDKYIWEFSNKEFLDSKGYFNHVKMNLFYWFQEDQINKFLSFLKHKNYIQPALEPIANEILNQIYEEKFNFIKTLIGL